MGSDCAKKMNVVSEKLNSLPASVKKGDPIVIQKTIITIIEHITVWLEIIEHHVILINNTKNPQEKARLSKFVQDQLVNVTQQLTVLKQTTSTITILRQEVITTVNWCLQSVENQILSIKHSHEQSTEKQIEKPENKSANIEKSKEIAVHEVKSEKDKPKPATFNLPIPDHANDFMDIIDRGGFSLDSEDEEIDNELPKENKSANIEKSKEDVVNEIKSEKDKPKAASFNLPIPEHANDFMEIIDGGGFSLDSEDEEEECALPDTHAQSLAQIEDMRDSGTCTIVKLDDVESQPQENVMTYTTIIKSKHVRHATYVSKECLDSMDKESVEQVETMKEEGSKIQSIVTEPKYDVKSMVSDVSLCSETEIPSEFSYASALVVGKAKPIEPVIEEPKKPYQYRDITKCPAEEETEPNSKDITDIPKDGFQEFLSKKEKRRRKTESQSENQDTIALVDEVQSVIQEQEDFNQDTNLESMMLGRIRRGKDKKEITVSKEKKGEMEDDTKNDNGKEKMESNDNKVDSKPELSSQNLPEKKKKKKKTKVKAEDEVASVEMESSLIEERSRSESPVTEVMPELGLSETITESDIAVVHLGASKTIKVQTIEKETHENDFTMPKVEAQ